MTKLIKGNYAVKVRLMYDSGEQSSIKFRKTGNPNNIRADVEKLLQDIADDNGAVSAKLEWVK